MGRLRSFINFISTLIAFFGLMFVMFVAFVAFQRATHAELIRFGSAVFAMVLLLAAGVIATRHIKKMLERRRPCAHGVGSGKEGGCQNCFKEEQQRRADVEAREAKRVREQETKKRAETLRF